MGNEKWIALAAIIFVAIIIGGTYNGLVQKQQAVKERESLYASALYLGSEKIEAVWSVYNTYLTHESGLFEKATKLRAQYYDAAAKGDPGATVKAAMEFNLLAVKEAYPQLVSAPVAQQTIDSMEEPINEMKTALDDWIVKTKEYNTKRGQFPGNVIGGIFNFPSEYDYYRSDKTKLNVSEILNK